MSRKAEKMGSRGDVSKEDEQVSNVPSVVSDEKVKPKKGMVRRIWSAMGLVGHLFFRNSKRDCNICRKRR